MPLDISMPLRFADTIREDQRNAVTIAFEQFRVSRELLRQGRYAAVGRTARLFRGEEVFSGDAEWRSAFDYDSERLLFSRNEPTMVTSHTANGEASEPAWEVMSGRSIIRPDETYDWNSAVATQIQIKEPNVEWIPLSKPIDIRSVGVCLVNQLPLRKGIESCLLEFGYLEVVDVRETDAEIKITFRLITGGHSVERALTLDKAFGYVPIHYNVSHRSPPDGDANIVSEIHCTWEMKNDTAVISSLWSREEIGPDADVQYELSFVWEAVNEPSTSDTFEKEALLDAHFARLFDMRGPSPTLVGVVNRGSPPRELRPVTQSSMWKYIYANAAIIFAALGIWMTRHFVARARKK